MDALLCSSGSVWSPSAEIVKSCNEEVDEVLRVLKSGGRFLYISFGQPHFRLPYLNREAWKGGVKVETLGEGGLLQYFLYQMEKNGDRLIYQADKSSDIECGAG
jgi:EEF1A lysine methyltransferase 4